jgi:energy-coupling factor transport system ATP-binding protein
MTSSSTPTPVATIDHVSFWYGADPAQRSTYYSPVTPEAPSPESDHTLHEGSSTPRSDAATLNDITLDITPGTVTLLCGASGSGKTSALQLLNGLVPHFHHGTITGAVRVSDLDIGSADIGACGEVSATVFQNPKTQFFTSSVRSELAFRMENHGVPQETMNASVKNTAEECGIAYLLDRQLKEMSGGELQKVACAQAISANTPLILFDEPTSNLSVEAIEDFAAMLTRLKHQGRTIVIAEHRLYFLRGLIDQAVLLEGGRIVKRMSGRSFFSQSDDERRKAGLRTLLRPSLKSHTTDQGAGSAISTTAHENTGLRLDHLHFSYGSKSILNINHAEFPKCSISALVGANGAGKSTLARLICGLLKEDKHSSITFDGKAVSPKQRTSISYIVMQDVHRQLFADSVNAEVTLGLKDADRTCSDTTRVLKELDLDAYASRHPLSLSGGQKQRLVIASAIACDKRVYVFDEPTSGVDYRHLTAISERLRALASQGAVVIVITHDIELLESCADRIVRLHSLQEDGIARDDGKPQLSTETVARSHGDQ